MDCRTVVLAGFGGSWLRLSCVAAAPAERDKEWRALIAAAVSRGATETKLDRSASYVFQDPDGDYLTFTRLLTTDKGRSVCLIKQNETATACADWDTGKLTLGKRADAATPWKFFAFDSLDAMEAAKPTMVRRTRTRAASAHEGLLEFGRTDRKVLLGRFPHRVFRPHRQRELLGLIVRRP